MHTTPRTAALALRTSERKTTPRALAYSDLVEQVIRASWDVDRLALESAITDRDFHKATGPYSYATPATVARLQGTRDAIADIFAIIGA